MSYVKTSWQTGDVVTAEKLNHLEDGVENAPGYTVTETRTVRIEQQDVTVEAIPDAPIDVWTGEVQFDLTGLDPDNMPELVVTYNGNTYNCSYNAETSSYGGDNASANPWATYPFIIAPDIIARVYCNNSTCNIGAVSVDKSMVISDQFCEARGYKTVENKAYAFPLQTVTDGDTLEATELADNKPMLTFNVNGQIISNVRYTSRDGGYLLLGDAGCIIEYSNSAWNFTTNSADPVTISGYIPSQGSETSEDFVLAVDNANKNLDGQLFIVNVSYDDTNEEYVADKTVADIYTAYTKKRPIICVYDAWAYNLAEISDSGVGFMMLNVNSGGYGAKLSQIGMTDNGVTMDETIITGTPPNNS